MKNYLSLLKEVLEENSREIEAYLQSGDKEHARADRTGVSTFSLFGRQLRFDLEKGFPVVTTKRVPFRLVVSELIWFLRGDTNIRFLLQHNNHIWDEWAFKRYVASTDYTGPDMTDFGLRATEDPQFEVQYKEQLALFCEKILKDDVFSEQYGELGPVYGKQWRAWEGKEGRYDQIAWIIKEIKRNPNSRQLILNGWNVADVQDGKMALPPCHTMFQLYVRDGKLDGQLYQRSCDLFLGGPFNFPSYALLIHFLAKWTGLEVGELVVTFGDSHIYSNHLTQVNEQLSREVRELPTLVLPEDIGELEDIYKLNPADITLLNYDHHPAIKAPVAV